MKRKLRHNPLKKQAGVLIFFVKKLPQNRKQKIIKKTINFVSVQNIMSQFDERFFLLFQYFVVIMKKDLNRVKNNIVLI